MKRTITTLVLALAGAASLSAAEPKRVLVVGATAAFRHPSIPNGETFLRQLAAEHKSEFTLTFMSDVADYPFSKIPTPNGGGGGGARGRGGFPGQVTAPTPGQQTAITELSVPLADLNTKATDARTALTAAAFSGTKADINARLSDLVAAELALATARQDALAKIQSSPNRLSADQVQGLAGTAPRGAPAPAPGAGGRGGADNTVLAKIFQQYMSPEALKNYDGIFFISTTGNLPIPDEPAFLRWVAEGHAIMGTHATMDRGNTSDAHMDMLAAGARFNGHPGNANAPSKVVRVDSSFPGTKEFPATLMVTDEFYSYHYHDLSGANGVDPAAWIPGVDYTKVHSLLNLDRGDGIAFPVSWVKYYGTGRVFYTSMGHRDDVMLPIPSLDYDTQRDNNDEVVAAFKAHVLGGMRWALGLAEGDATPGNFKADPKAQAASAAQGARGGAPGGARGAAPAPAVRGN